MGSRRDDSGHATVNVSVATGCGVVVGGMACEGALPQDPNGWGAPATGTEPEARSDPTAQQSVILSPLGTGMGLDWDCLEPRPSWPGTTSHV
ncbi:hypothetical protein F5Y12DRAFT_711211 [Xylaria sp. FL1777]|nr:hypothetical protein F5Y12DRAFT_711211 [Xylaria sp. FL1777]